MWGGVECTVNRVGDRYRDQIRLSGHHDRLDDLDRFAALGIKALRFPVLWERTAAAGEPDWRWPDERLDRLRALGICPIVGLVHHGSGPRYTHLLADDFAPGLGRFAGMVGERYPWVEAWTPVNEPLTTARFAALYGHWYPHAADERSFWQALLNQVDATRAAMTAIRRVNPAARLIATDDLGRTYSTAELAEQAAHDNLRRWAGWDFLFGRIDRDHALFDRLDRMGLGDRLRAIADDPCPPDVIGLNHYLTSDRFLDHRLGRYPAHLHGGNGRDRYADTEALRASAEKPAGLAGALRDTWERYHTPIAITEVHNGSTREEQLRWAAQAWDTAQAAAMNGIDVVGVTAWSLLGSHGWDTLLTGEGSYEAGVFDTSSGEPRETALAMLWRGLPLDAERHPVAQQRGWWERPERLLYTPALEMDGSDDRPTRPLLIVGANDAAGQACARRGITQVTARGSPDDPLDEDVALHILRATDPWCVCIVSTGPADQGAILYEAVSQVSDAWLQPLVRACLLNGTACFHLRCDEQDEAVATAIDAGLNALIDQVATLTKPTYPK